MRDSCHTGITIASNTEAKGRIRARERSETQAPQGFPGTEAPGVSVFFRDGDGAVYHTYSSYGRGIDILNGAYNYIDLTPKGRDEGERSQSWVRRHDEYGV